MDNPWKFCRLSSGGVSWYKGKCLSCFFWPSPDICWLLYILLDILAFHSQRPTIRYLKRKFAFIKWILTILSHILIEMCLQHLGKKLWVYMKNIFPNCAKSIFINSVKLALLYAFYAISCEHSDYSVFQNMSSPLSYKKNKKCNLLRSNKILQKYRSASFTELMKMDLARFGKTLFIYIYRDVFLSPWAWPNRTPL